MTGRAATLQDVAVRAGVSVATASNVLSAARPVSAELTERVVAAVQELGYRRNETARSLRTGQRQAIGVVIPDVTNPFFADLVRELTAAADRVGSSVLLCDSGFDATREARYLERLGSAVDGVVLCSTGPRAAPVGALTRAGLPVVACDEPVPGVACVVSDNAGGAAAAARHLVEAGCRAPALISGPATLPTAGERERGFRAALAELGVPLPEYRVVRVPYSLDGGRQGIARLLAADPAVDGVLASTDLQAIGAVFESAALGREVPADLLVCGFDGIAWGERIRPRLTTVAQDVPALAAAAFDALMRQVEGGTAPARTEVPVHLLVRESTGA